MKKEEKMGKGRSEGTLLWIWVIVILFAGYIFLNITGCASTFDGIRKDTIRLLDGVPN